MSSISLFSFQNMYRSGYFRFLFHLHLQVVLVARYNIFGSKLRLTTQGAFISNEWTIVLFIFLPQTPWGPPPSLIACIGRRTPSTSALHHASDILSSVSATLSNVFSLYYGKKKRRKSTKKEIKKRKTFQVFVIIVHVWQNCNWSNMLWFVKAKNYLIFLF